MRTVGDALADPTSYLARMVATQHERDALLRAVDYDMAKYARLVGIEPPEEKER